MNGIDYAFNPHPPTSAIKAGGFGFVCRYISSFAPNDSNGKNLLAGELKQLRAAGLKVVVVAEEGATDMLGGRARGVQRAQHADAVVKALGMKGIPIYFAADDDFTPGQQAPINAYLDGAASVIGRNRVGIYGGLHVVRRAYQAGKCAYVWQTLAWSGGEWFSQAHLRQVHNGIRVGGASADLNVAMHNDFGQWPRPSGPGPKQPDPPAPKGRRWIEWKTAGKSSLADVAQATGIPPATILRFTAHHYGKFDKVTYDYVNDVFGGKKSHEDKIPAGAKLWVHEKEKK